MNRLIDKYIELDRQTDRLVHVDLSLKQKQLIYSFVPPKTIERKMNCLLSTHNRNRKLKREKYAPVNRFVAVRNAIP